ncbi:transposase, partial [Acinetobacter baumannii]
DTPIPVLDPGRGRTKTGRLWVYARDDRPWNGPDPPAALYLYSSDRKAERPASHLTTFSGVVRVDGYPGFDRLREGGR